jgi:hypothetical protein
MKFDLIIQKPSFINIVLFLFCSVFLIKLKLFTIIILVFSYLYTDFTFFIMHLYLDQSKTLDSKINLIKNLAIDFQNHHLNPKDFLNYNSVSKIDILNSLVLIPNSIFLLLKLINVYNLSNSEEYILLFFLFISLFSFIALANHYFCHAITHQDELNKKNNQFKIFKFLQDNNFLPNSKFHKKHHEDEVMNYDFLNGFSKFYLQIFNLNDKIIIY